MPKSLNTLKNWSRNSRIESLSGYFCINAYLFGKYSDAETERLPATNRLFDLMNAGQVVAVVSLYSVQEVYSFCKKIFSPDEAGHISRLSLSDLFKNSFVLTGLLTREERQFNRPRFNMQDLSDQPHAISAFLNKCDAIVTYDEHFQYIKETIAVVSPEDVIIS